MFTGGEDEPGKYHCTKAGFINGIDQFNPLEFGILAKEATHFDPAIRLTLEAAQAVGIPPSAFTLPFIFHLGASRFWYRLQGFKYRCFFLATYLPPQTNLTMRGLESTTTIALAVVSIRANRISFTFDLRGPSLTVETGA